MHPESVIVLGATGNVGSIVAANLHKDGVETFLASRSVNKPVPSEISDLERYQIDLTKPDTVQVAVEQTGATRAFMYCLMESQDGMRSVIEALKKGGIRFVVLLSSYIARGNKRNYNPASNFMAYTHARVEINLEEVFGADGGYLAVQPGYYATNSLRWKDMIASGTVSLAYPEASFNWTSSQDIGLVCSRALIHGPYKDINNNVITISGPEILSQRQAIDIIGGAIGKPLRLKELNDEEAVAFWIEQAHLPETDAKALISIFQARARNQDDLTEYHAGSDRLAHVGNIAKYGGREATRFEQWVIENKEAFL
ncbi:hypothetical protein NW762_011945 [Fusarium torreyae]|uniref:NmrA-like domain-containing protein n=1 Tax=Fusarium torreyae TaxID=1237075 RepID=A0A9W8RS22_9HYPO|nr:hypothetical protein NW762_011945 [Fusarium torreyae]